MDLSLHIDRRARTPLPLQIAYGVQSALIEGRLPPGARLPSTRALAERLGVARMVVVHAFEWLASEGYTETSRGGGTTISKGLILPQSPPDLKQAPERRTDRLPPTSPVVDFRPGLPALDSFPRTEWRSALNHVIRNAPDDAFGYGPIEGLPKLRRAIAEYSSRTRGLPFAPERVVVTAGAAQALSLILRVVHVSRALAIEDPSPVPVHELAHLHGRSLLPVAVDDDGMCTGDLPSGESAPGVIYVVPSHQYPTGVVMSLSRRLALLDWAAKNNAYIVEDDYDSEFRYDGMPPTALAAMDRANCTIYVGTFSKMLCPALRLGYLIAPEPLIDRLLETKWWTDRGGPVIDQLALTHWLESGSVDRHVLRTRKLYARRRNALVSALGAAFGARVRISGVPAGMHLMASFDDLADDEEFASRMMARHGIALYPASRCAIAYTQNKNSLIFGFGHLHEEVAGSAISIIRDELLRV
ncbi:transcriptional regulator with HTH domain and aminotransferase domain [Rhizobium leguminosarum bv. trifolii WSM597]|uniref:Transcriptional regulator, GntR family with aminotransferase domain n=2 Tax=Rhizobium leguminosarum bv. trifolii TaxID=386 RepID=A0ABF7QVD7_RHILW|nr:PLP-dependent aminotransferase family protein [Rhizobium leguminosarum]ACI58110.1 transcriptional regulator, GntR family with aminotransferase domain [Rhizobium leguminosarum bv. trifolii WSM2304]EJB06901.1 transcriptional regulator with HTH domain and aminotransferase domain [Rhizobium leguminosarum bv. trifolii WSM597]